MLYKKGYPIHKVLRDYQGVNYPRFGINTEGSGPGNEE